jgi:tripartite ATP-independent transporter DctP family solute receptor
MKKKIVLLTVVFVCFSLLGLYAGGSQDSAGKSEEKVTFQLNHVLPPNHSIQTAMLFLAERAKEQSNGKIEIQVFPSSTLGTERESQEALMAGTLDMALMSYEAYLVVIPEIGSLILPFLYNDYAHGDRVFAGPAGKKAHEIILQKANSRVLSHYIQAFRQIFSQKPFKTAADIVGIKIRVPESPLYVNTFTLLGAAPTPVAWAETYSALDSGVVQAVENTPEATHAMAMDEVTKYINLTDHLLAPTTISMSEKIFSRQPAEVQKALLAAAAKTGEYGLQLTQENDTVARKAIAAKLQVIEPDKKSFRDKMEYSKFDVMKYPVAQEIKALIDATK